MRKKYNLRRKDDHEILWNDKQRWCPIAHWPYNGRLAMPPPLLNDIGSDEVCWSQLSFQNFLIRKELIAVDDAIQRTHGRRIKGA